MGSMRVGNNSELFVSITYKLRYGCQGGSREVSTGTLFYTSRRQHAMLTLSLTQLKNHIDLTVLGIRLKYGVSYELCKKVHPYLFLYFFVVVWYYLLYVHM